MLDHHSFYCAVISISMIEKQVHRNAAIRKIDRVPNFDITYLDNKNQERREASSVVAQSSGLSKVETSGVGAYLKRIKIFKS